MPDSKGAVQGLILRPYQERMVGAWRGAVDRGVRRGLIVAATGTGKTTVFSAILQASAAENPEFRALVLAHRQELLEQAAGRISLMGSGIKVATHSGARKAKEGTDIVVGSVQSLGIAKSTALDWLNPDLVIVDEAHHAAARTYQNVFRRFGCYDEEDGTYLLGVTATPHRMDNLALHGTNGAIFEELVFKYDIVQAIQDGFLVDLRGYRAVADYDLSRVKTVRGDYMQSQLQNTMNTEAVTTLAFESWAQVAQDRATIVFCSGVEHAKCVADRFNLEGITAEAVYGDMPREDRDRILRDFQAGRIQVLTNMDVLTEGYDAQHCSAILLLRPTQSWSLFCLDKETEILTPDGWKKWNEVGEGDVVGSYYSESGEIVWEQATGYVARPLYEDERMFEYRSPSLDFRVTDRHRMLWRNRKKKGPFEFVLAKDLAAKKSEFEVPVAGIQDAPGLPLSDDELRFIGWFLSDGTLNRGTGSIQITQAEHQPHREELVKCLKGCGFKFVESVAKHKSQFQQTSPRIIYRVNKGKPRGTDKHLRGWGDLEPYIDKQLSDSMEDIDARQLGVVLEALHFGDGAKQLNQSWTRRTYHISTGRREFADRLQSLCVRRGYRCNLATWTNTNGNPIYILHIKKGVFRHVGGSNAKDRPTIRESLLRPDDIAWCVTVPSTAIITRRHGKVLITGNTQMVGRGLRCLPNVIEGIHEAETRRNQIRTSKKADCVVIDIVGNTRMHEVGKEGAMEDKPSLQALVGLPPEMDLEGKTLGQAVDEFGKLPDYMKAAAYRRKTSFSGLTGVLTQVEMISELDIPDEAVVQEAQLYWLKVGENKYMLDIGGRGVDAKGRMCLLEFDTLGNWWLTLSSHHRPPEKYPMGNIMEGVFVRAENKVREVFFGVSRLAARDARWRGEKPTEDQVAFLKTKGIDEIVIEQLDQGKASALVTMMGGSG